MPALLVLICGYIYALLHIVESSKCPTISLSHSSPEVGVVSNGSNYTLYQDFVTEENASDLNITWRRVPSELDSSSDTFRMKKHVISSTTLKASLILWNIQESGKYTVTASNECGMCNTSIFHIQVHFCEQYEKPEPLTHHDFMVLAEPELPNILHLSVTFLGASDGGYQTLWRFGDAYCLEYGSHTSQISCNRTVLPQCRFEAHLWIANITHANSNNYIVKAANSEGDSGNSSTVDLRIVQHPRINYCQSGPVHTDHSGRAQFMCQLSNYSEYAKVVVVESNHTTYNESTKELSFACQPNQPDPSLATCTVNISTSLRSGKLQYKVCVGYNASYERLQCSDGVTVLINTDRSNNPTLARGLIAGASGVALLSLLLVLISILARKCYRGRQIQWSTAHDATRPLLDTVKDVIITEQDAQQTVSPSVGAGAKEALPSESTTAEGTEDDIEDLQRSGVDANGTSTEVPLWQTVRSGLLERVELVHVARAIGRWSVLARCLGLSESAIVAIKENNVHDYEEQKFQMLLRWSQEQPTSPTRQDLVQIIEEKMKDSTLAQDVVNIVGANFTMST